MTLIVTSSLPVSICGLSGSLFKQSGVVMKLSRRQEAEAGRGEVGWRGEAVGGWER